MIMSEADFLAHNNKKKICDVYINSNLYPVYEYNLRDVSMIERLVKDNCPESDVTVAMLKLAIPDIDEDEIYSLTQSQSAELIAHIESTSVLNKIVGISSTMH